MPILPSAVARRVALRHGVIAGADLRDAGLATHDVSRLVGRGVLRRVHPGVYVAAGRPLTFEQRCAAACVADPDVVVSGSAAARLWGFDGVFRPRVPELRVASGGEIRLRGVSVRRRTTSERPSIGRDPMSHVVRRRDGIRLTNPALTWFDCIRDLDDDGLGVLTASVIAGWCSPRELFELARPCDSRARSALTRQQRVLSNDATWQKPADSPLEHKVVRALRRTRLANIDASVPIALASGMTIHTTAADLRAKWAVEIDHVSWHGGRFGNRLERERRREVARAGWELLTVTDSGLDADTRACLAAIVADHRAHVASVAA